MSHDQLPATTTPQDTPHFKIGLKWRAKHGLLYQFMQSKGWNQTELGKKCGLAPSHMADILNLKIIPGRKIAKRIAGLTRIPEMDLFPPQFRPLCSGHQNGTYYQEVPTERLQLADPQVTKWITEDSRQAHIKQEEQALSSDMVQKLFSMLKPREVEVLRLRFEIGKTRIHTLEEVGDIFGISRERVRQIESKAMKILRSSTLVNEVLMK